MEKFILVTGNPVDGFKYTGPFNTEEEAEDMGENLIGEIGDWWVAPLTLFLGQPR